MVKGVRKIYRTSANYRKKRNQKILKAFLIIILLAALVFLGYSVAKPIHNFIVSKTGKNVEDEEVWSPPVVTEQIETEAEEENEQNETTEKAEEEKKPVSDTFSAYQAIFSAGSRTDDAPCKTDGRPASCPA